MIYEYETAKEKITIDVEEKWRRLLFNMDRLEHNNDQTERRRHVSLDALNLDETLIPSKEDIHIKIAVNERNTALYSAIMKLKPAQNELVQSIYYENMSICKHAASKGVSQSAISQRLHTIYKILKKSLNQPYN